VADLESATRDGAQILVRRFTQPAVAIGGRRAYAEWTATPPDRIVK
jgi:hypothetical protein